MDATRGVVVAASGGKHLDTAAPGRSAALTLLGHETNDSIMLVPAPARSSRARLP